MTTFVLYVMINAWWQDLVFRVIDTARQSPHDILEPGQEVPLQSLDYTVGARSVVVLISR